MKNLDIRKFDDPILRKKTKEVKTFDKDLELLIQDMIATMEENNGVGLAAPQIGIGQKIIVFKDLKSLNSFELINPKIIKRGGKKELGEEGCLSFPGIFLKIKRSKKIEVIGKNRKGENVKIKAEDITARILQHEIDHLEGVVFFDRLNFFKRLTFKKSGFNRFFSKK